MWHSIQHLSIAPFTLPMTLRSWLTDPGSLVKRLRAHGAIEPKIKLLRQYWGYPFADESLRISLSRRKFALIREVLIGEEGRAYVYARTVFPRATLSGKEKILAHLGTRTLGSLLFKHPQLTRSAFEIAQIERQMPWHEHIHADYPLDHSVLWARRSVFAINEKSILVTEVFLPPLSLLY